MSIDLQHWLNAIERLPVSNPEQYKLKKTFRGVLQFIHKMQWQGACHATSGVFTVLLQQQDISAKPYLGECSINGAFFDHSWVEVNSDIYDVAISNTLIPQWHAPPVFAGISVESMEATTVSYGVASGAGLDTNAKFIKNTPFVEYMDQFPNHPQGLWGISKDIGKSIGMKLNVSKMRNKAQALKWHERT